MARLEKEGTGSRVPETRRMGERERDIHLLIDQRAVDDTDCSSKWAYRSRQLSDHVDPTIQQPRSSKRQSNQA